MTVYRPHITVDHYRELVEAKYQRTVKGWALIDPHGAVQGWHQVVPGDNQWASAESALQSFMPDTRARQWCQRLGWTVCEDLDRYWLSEFLATIRTGYKDHGGG